MPKHMKRSKTRKGKQSKRRGSTRRMKGGVNFGSLFTRKNNARAPRPEGPAREGSVLYNSAIKTYKANKDKMDVLVKNLKAAVNEQMKKEIPEYNINSSNNAKKNLVVKKGITQEKLKELSSMPITVSAEGTKEARDALETLLKLSVKEKKSAIKGFIQSHMNMVPGVKKAMELMGVQNETINSLFDSVDNGTMTVGKAELLVLLIKNKHMLLTDAAKRNLGVSQSGGLSAGDSFGMWTIAFALALPTSGISLLVALVIQIFSTNE